MVAWKLQFLISVHFHFWNGVLYEEKHFQKLKFDISWKKCTPLLKSSGLDFRTFIADHGNIYDKITFFTKLWLGYHFIFGFWYKRTHLLGPNWLNPKKSIFRPPWKTPYFKKTFLRITRKLLNSQKKS